MRKRTLAQRRRVRLVVRRIEPWTVLKFSVLLFVTLYLVILVAGMVLWAAATATGLRENVEKFIGELIASDDFSLIGAAVAKASILGGAVLVVMGTGVNVLMAVLYNLIADVVGGMIVLFEERPGRRRSRTVEPGGDGEAPPPLRASRRSRRRARRRARPPRPPREQSSGAEPPSAPEPVEVQAVELTRPSD